MILSKNFSCLQHWKIKIKIHFSSVTSSRHLQTYKKLSGLREIFIELDLHVYISEVTDYLEYAESTKNKFYKKCCRYFNFDTSNMWKRSQVVEVSYFLDEKLAVKRRKKLKYFK